MRCTSLLRIRFGMHAPGCHDPVAVLRLSGRDQQILISGGTQIRLGIQIPADDALHHQRPQSGFPEYPVQFQKGLRFHGLHHHLMHYPTLHRRFQFRMLLPQRRIDRIMDQRQHLVHLRQIQQLLPLFPGLGIFPFGCFSKQRRLQYRQEDFIDFFHSLFYCCRGL